MPGRCLWQGHQHSHGTFRFFGELDSVSVGQELRTYEAETALGFLRPAAHHGLPFLVLSLAVDPCFNRFIYPNYSQRDSFSHEITQRCQSGLIDLKGSLCSPGVIQRKQREESYLVFSLLL